MHSLSEKKAFSATLIISHLKLCHRPFKYVDLGRGFTKK